MQNVIWVSSIRPKLEKNNDSIPRKHPDRGEDGQTLFCRTHRATAVDPINIVKVRLAEKGPLLLQNPYFTNKKQFSFYK